MIRKRWTCQLHPVRCPPLPGYPVEQTSESGSDAAIERLRQKVRETEKAPPTDAEISALYDAASHLHKVPCYGCGRVVHGEYCFHWGGVGEGLVICDPCSTHINSLRQGI